MPMSPNPHLQGRESCDTIRIFWSKLLLASFAMAPTLLYLRARRIHPRARAWSGVAQAYEPS